MNFKKRLNEAKINAYRRVWRSININRSLDEIGNDVGMTATNVKTCLRLVGLNRKKPKKSAKPYEPPAWTDSVDWTLQDAHIAKLVGLTRERIRQIRILLGKPKSPNHGKHANHLAHQWFMDNMNLSGTMTAKELSKIIHVTDGAARRMADEHGFELKRPDPIRPWDDVDWRLPNADLSEIWKVKDPPSQRVHGFRFAQERNRQNRPKPKWSRAFGRKPDSHEYQIALGQEQAKADQWFKKQTSNTKEQNHEISVLACVERKVAMHANV